jgi:hypothetical protein
MLTVFKAEFFPEVEPEAEARREMIDAQMASEVGVKLNWEACIDEQRIDDSTC